MTYKKLPFLNLANIISAILALATIVFIVLIIYFNNLAYIAGAAICFLLFISSFNSSL